MVKNFSIEIAGVSKSYAGHRAVQNLSLEVREAEMFGFLGPNGAGKTTTIRLLLGLMRPDNGEIRLLGQNINGDEKAALAVRTRLGYLPDIARIEGSFRGGEWLDYLARLQVNQPDAHFRRELCDRLELSQTELKRKVSGFSRGMRQKLSIIQALQHRPSLLILDEPTEGLDPLSKRALFDLLEEARRRDGATVFFSSHILSEVERVCDRVALIKAGQLVATDSIATLRNRQTRRVEVFLREKIEEFGEQARKLPGAVEVAREGQRWRLAWQGELNSLLSLLSSCNPLDVVIEPPDLEDIFLGYYRQEITPPPSTSSPR
jgi:ABC-2 type transport system ATP-binding protein